MTTKLKRTRTTKWLCLDQSCREVVTNRKQHLQQKHPEQIFISRTELGYCFIGIDGT